MLTLQVVLPIEASLSPHDPLAKWEDHEACWQMQYRGSLGKQHFRGIFGGVSDFREDFK